ncbi:MAG: vitamin B12 dependent-methionine synthase activation domain-containing protein, partial [Bauldia sp.]
YRRGQTVHVLDASRAVGVASSLIGENRKAYAEKVRAEYRDVAEGHARHQADKKRITLAAARANRFAIDWAGYAPPKPSFLGVRAYRKYSVAELTHYIDWTPFFATWEMKGTYPHIFDDALGGAAARALFADAQGMLKQMVAENWLTANGVVGFFPANADGDDIVLYADESRTKESTRLYTLRQQMARSAGNTRAHTALADFVAPQETGLADYVGGFAVTAGIGEEAVAERFARANDDYSKILSQALADRLAEAFAERLHERVRRELWGYTADEQLSRDELLREAYRGIRPAPGYPAQPDHTEKATLFALLDAEKVTGIKLTESYAMWPGSSVS